MKKLLLITLFLLGSLFSKAQNTLHAGELDWSADITIENSSAFKAATASCGTPFLSSGYPVFTNFWAGYMLNIVNTSACPIVINSFEARFQGTSGYRIYTKVGTFVGFELLAGSWVLVGNLASLTGTSTVAPTIIPIAVNVVIPAGGTQAFYLTRSDNLVANRHLYIAGAGTAGTTIYAFNADLGLTEASYIDPYFAALQVGSRRPSLDVCYTVNCLLPIELLSFDGIYSNNRNTLKWSVATQINNDYFTIEKSTDGYTWNKLGNVDGVGNTTNILNYSIDDFDYSKTINYYRLSQTDYNGTTEYFNIIAIDNTNTESSKPIRITNILGQDVDNNYNGLKIYIYPNGTYSKKVETSH